MYCKCYFAALWELSHAKKASWVGFNCLPEAQEHEKQAADGSNAIQLIPQVKARRFGLVSHRNSTALQSILIIINYLYYAMDDSINFC